MVLEDLEDLINLAITSEERLSFDHLSENTSNRPNINSKAVLFLS